MQVPYDEGVANHIGPESCAVAREVLGEALTGECIGQPLSRERVERRAGAEGNASQQSADRAQNRANRVAGAGARTASRKISVSPSSTQGGSRVQESCPHGSERGAVSNGRPYRTSH